MHDCDNIQIKGDCQCNGLAVYVYIFLLTDHKKQLISGEIDFTCAAHEYSISLLSPTPIMELDTTLNFTYTVACRPLDQAFQSPCPYSVYSVHLPLYQQRKSANWQNHFTNINNISVSTYHLCSSRFQQMYSQSDVSTNCGV